MPDQHLRLALDDLLDVATEAMRVAKTHRARPKDAARAFHNATLIGMRLQDLAGALRRRARDTAEDPDADLTDQQRHAYQETFDAFGYLAVQCIGLSAGMHCAANALDHLAEVTRKHPDVTI